MAITKKDVEYAGRLARLEITEQEKDKYASQLGAILEYVDKLNKLDTKNVPPTSHAQALSNVWREDKHVPAPDSVREGILSNAPEREDDYFKVKKVIE